MKNLFRLLFIALLGGAMASALDAERVKLTVVKPTSPLKLTAVSPPNGSGYFASPNKDSGKSKANPNKWHYLAIPLKVEAETRSGKKPDFIPEMQIDVTVLVSIKTTDKPLMLKKTLHYINIPLSNKGDGYFNAGVLLAPTDVSRLSVQKNKDGEGGNGDLSDSLAGYAVEARFDGALCNVVSDREPSDYIYVSSLKSKMGVKWWTSTRFSSGGIRLYGIDETPFAPFYSPTFPQTKSVYSVPQTRTESAPSASEEDDTAPTATPSSGRASTSGSRTTSSRN